jgi:hypothetical protein
MDIKSQKLFMIMLGATPPGRHIEQHDIFFGIGTSLKDLAADMKAFWPEPERIHIDVWREVTVVENYRVVIVPKDQPENPNAVKKKLFFINLGGYQENKFEEQHYVLLTVKDDRAAAFTRTTVSVRPAAHISMTSLVWMWMIFMRLMTCWRLP